MSWARLPSRVLIVGLLALNRPAHAADDGKVLGLMERTADWQLAHMDSGAPGERASDGWIKGAFYTGVMALAGQSKSPRFHDAMMQMGEANQWRPGRRPYHADDHVVTQTYLDLYLQHHDPRMLGPTKERFDWILAHPATTPLDFDRKTNPRHQERWSWCDALFMAPPAWARLWKATGDRRYLDFAVAEWWTTSDFLYDKEEHLFFRDSTLFAKREANGKKIFWSRGNGWVLAGLVRMLELLPADHPARPRFERQFREMADKIVTLQQPDGFWRASLLAAEHFPMQETSGTGFYTYAFAWGLNHGLLPRDRFEPSVRRAWEALVSCVNADGKLTHVQPVGFTPVTFDADHSEPFGVGAFLLAGSEVSKLPSPSSLP
jgi:unsaturated rhamnogalacturonyl hydrolase